MKEAGESLRVASTPSQPHLSVRATGQPRSRVLVRGWLARNDSPGIPSLASRCLLGILGVDAAIEWSAFPGIQMYSPRVDVAVGPFSVEVGSLGPEYDQLLGRHREFFQGLTRIHDVNVRSFDPSEDASDWSRMDRHN